MLQKYLIEKIKLLKNRIETFTGYKYSQIQDALTIGTLLTIITKLSSVIFIDYRIPILINLAFLLFYFLLSLKFDLIYYVRESLAYLLSIILGKRIQFREDAFCCIYHEEDAFKSPLPDTFKNKKIKTNDDLSEFIYTYEKVPGLKYDFIEPTENIFNRFFQYICIFLIYIKLLTLKIPIIFYCIKTFLFFMLITNHLLPLTYIISIVLIFSRILLLLSDFTMEKFYRTYHLFKEQDSHWTGEYIEATTIPVNFNNACVFFIWAIRALEKEDRKDLDWEDKNFVKINEVMWNQKYFSKYKDLLISYEDKTGYYMFNLILAFIIIISYKYMMETKYETFQFSGKGILSTKVRFKNELDKPWFPLTNLGIKKLQPKELHKGYCQFDDANQTIFTTVIGTFSPNKTYPNVHPQILKNIDVKNTEFYTINGKIKAIHFSDLEVYLKTKFLMEENFDFDPTRDFALDSNVYNNTVINFNVHEEYKSHIPGYQNNDLSLNHVFSPSAQLYNGSIIPNSIMLTNFDYPLEKRLNVVSHNIKHYSSLLRLGEENKQLRILYKDNLNFHTFFIKNQHEFDKFKTSHPIIVPGYQKKMEKDIEKFIEFATEISKPRIKNFDIPRIADATGFDITYGCDPKLSNVQTSQKYYLQNLLNNTNYSNTRKTQKMINQRKPNEDIDAD